MTRKHQSLARYYRERIAYHELQATGTGRIPARHRLRLAIYRTRLDQVRFGARSSNVRGVA